MSSGSPRRLAAVIGFPARHSRSPAIHSAAFAATGIDWAFTAFEAPSGSGAAALEAMRVLGLGGLSVTMPLKAEVAAAADCVDAEVSALGASNCIVPLSDGRLRAANTDVSGFLEALRTDAEITPQGLRVALLGGGGAACAVAWALATAGASDVAVLNRTPARAEAVAAVASTAAASTSVASTAAANMADISGELATGSLDCSGAQVGRVGSIEDISAADLVVNATSLGMGADTSLPCDPALLRPGQVAVDLIYEPLETRWLAQLRQRGVQAHNGLSMLVHQAAAAFELWTFRPAPLDAMRRAAFA